MQIDRFEALVIGAGMAGACAGAFLSATRRVALLEAEESAGYHTTGRSAAIWVQNYGPADVRALTGASRDFFTAPPPGFAQAPLFSPRPIVFLAPDSGRAALTALLDSGQGIQPVDLAALKAQVPPLRLDHIVAAAAETGGFDMDVAALHQGFLRQVTAAGGILALRHRAGRLWHDKGLWHAESSTGAIHAAPVLVNAAGAWGDVVARIAGVAPIGLQPKRRTAALIDPGPYDSSHWPMLNDIGEDWYVRPEARRKLMVSPADETPSEPMDARPEEIDIAIAIDRMQQALDIPVQRVEHSWAGLRTFTPDGSLAIGQSEAPGFFWMCGQGGYGIQTAPAAGKLLADLVEGRDPGALAAILPAIDPRRFARAAA